MATSIAQKLRIKEGMSLLTINAPADFSKTIQPLPAGAKASPMANEYEQIHWFVKDRADMEKHLSKILKLIKDDILCWIYYPKGSSKIQTDLSRDKGWESLLKLPHLQWITLISLDDTWSAFSVRIKNDTDVKKADKTKERPILDFIDAVKKTIRLPPDLATEMKKSKKGHSFFETLSFSNKKEYVEWVVSAKREETRKERIKGTIERLEKAWKNPSNN